MLSLLNKQNTIRLTNVKNTVVTTQYIIRPKQNTKQDKLTNKKNIK